MLLHLLLCVCELVEVLGQRSVMDEIQRLYLERGIPFKENVFLDNSPILLEYDFIVIGSGPAGSAIANRLSEVPEWNVLLLEMGQEPNIYNDIPFINPISILGNFSKFYKVEKRKNACQGLVNEQCIWPAGEVVGGATVINAMLYTRGLPSDFDEWEAEGNPGWSYRDVLPYFLKYENIAIPQLQRSEYHGKGGPVQVEYPFKTRLGDRFLEGAKELGYELVDYNNPSTPLGFSRSQVSMKQGRRVSALSAYLLPAKNRKNLHIAKNTPATRILFDPLTKRAYGVKFISKGRLREVMAKKEVILSAGAFNSPKLLMLSGIGHKSHLERLGIPVVKDLPVGDNLQEHLGTPLLSFFINTTESIVFPKILKNTPAYFFDWISGKGGIFSHNGAEGLGYIKTKLSNVKPDIELIFLPVTPGADAGAMLRKTISIKDDLYNHLWNGHFFREGFTICPMIMYPKSKGHVRLRSKNFKDSPIIDANFFDHPYDTKVIVEGIKAAIRLTKTKPFLEIGAKQHIIPLKMCDHFKFNSEEYWDCAIRAVPIQWHHQCCTNKMGPDPKMSVVDNRLRVHGIPGLRVADASIMPKIPGPHTMAPSYMIGEKAADLIKQDWASI